MLQTCSNARFAISLPRAEHPSYLSGGKLLPAMVRSVVHPIVDGIGPWHIRTGIVYKVRIATPRPTEHRAHHGRGVIDEVTFRGTSALESTEIKVSISDLQNKVLVLTGRDPSNGRSTVVSSNRLKW